jgi:hypothetical protein
LYSQVPGKQRAGEVASGGERRSARRRGGIRAAPSSVRSGGWDKSIGDLRFSRERERRPNATCPTPRWTALLSRVRSLSACPRAPLRVQVREHPQASAAGDGTGIAVQGRRGLGRLGLSPLTKAPQNRRTVGASDDCLPTSSLPTRQVGSEDPNPLHHLLALEAQPQHAAGDGCAQPHQDQRFAEPVFGIQ